MPMKLEAIHRAVEQELGGSVSFHSVYSHLLNHMKGTNALFERPSHGYYCLRGSNPQP